MMPLRPAIASLEAVTSVISSLGALPLLCAQHPYLGGNPFDRWNRLELAPGGLVGALGCAVGDEHERGLVAEALLTHARDRHVVLGEGAGHRRQNTSLVRDRQDDVVTRHGLFSR